MIVLCKKNFVRCTVCQVDVGSSLDDLEEHGNVHEEMDISAKYDLIKSYAVMESKPVQCIECFLGFSASSSPDEIAEAKAMLRKV